MKVQLTTLLSRHVLPLSLLLAVTFASAILYLAQASIIELIVDHNKSDAMVLARHISVDVLGDAPFEVRTIVAEDRIQKIRKAESSFNLYKLKIFSGDGTVLYSTDQSEMGSRNERDYFHGTVAQGNTYQKIVTRESPAGAGGTAQIIETYLPVMQDGVFIGAFEIYTDLSSSTLLMRQFLNKLSMYILLLGSTFIGIVMFLSRRAAAIQNELTVNKLLLERQQADSQLRETMIFLEQVMESGGNSIFVLDRDGRFILTSKASESLTGYAHEELSGRHYTSLLPLEAVPQADALFDEVIRLGKPVTDHELPILRKDGSLRVILIGISPLCDGPAVTKVVGAAVDITGRKHMEDELRRYQGELESKVSELAASEAELRSHRTRLKELVSERTADLGLVVERLEAEASQRQRAEAEMRVARDLAEAQYIKLHTMLSGMDEGVLFADRDGRIIEINDYYCRLLNQERADIMEAPVEKAIDMGDSQISSLIDLFRRGGPMKPVSVNQRMFDCDMTVRIQPVLKGGVYEGVLINLIDVTPLVEAHRSVEREKAFLEKVLATAGAAIFTTDRNGRITNVNDEFTAITGYSREEVLGLDSRFFIDGPSPDQHVGVSESRPRAKVQCTVLTRSAERITVLMNTDVLLAPEGKPAGSIGSFVDVTALTVARLRAEEASRLKGEFLANMSHEIRTPMNGLLGLVQILEKTPLSTEQNEFISLIKTAAENLLVILGDILDFSKIEAGRMEILPGRENLPALMEEMRTLVESQAGQKGIEIELVLSPDLPTVVAVDGVRLRQVLMNLLSNAVKFTSRGRIVLQASLISGSDTPGATAWVRFEVEDTGIGIPEELRQKIFEAFVQGDGSIARDYGGTGLGLSISNKLVLLMGGGQMEVIGQKGRGSRFAFALPLSALPADATVAPPEASVGGTDEQTAEQRADEEETPSPAMPGRAPHPYSSLRVLVAEDNVLNQFLLRKVLTNFGMARIEFAMNGKQAVDRMRDEPDGFDCVLMDIQMPMVDGLTASRQLREMGIDVPIVALTAHAMDRDRDKCFGAGMDYYLAKPYKIAALRQVFEDIMTRLVQTGTGRVAVERKA